MFKYLSLYTEEKCFIHEYIIPTNNHNLSVPYLLLLCIMFVDVVIFRHFVTIKKKLVNYYMQ